MSINEDSFYEIQPQIDLTSLPENIYLPICFSLKIIIVY